MTKDGNLLVVLSHKNLTFLRRKTKGQLIRWTVVWRRLNKKFKADKNLKKKKKRTNEGVKGISGMTQDEIQRRMNMTPEELQIQRDRIALELK